MTQNISNSEEAISLVKEFRALLKDAGLTEDQMKKLFGDLDKAMLLNLTGKLYEKLSTEDKALFKDSKFDRTEDFLDFFKTKISTPDLKNYFFESSNEVMEKFFSKLEK